MLTRRKFLTTLGLSSLGLLFNDGFFNSVSATNSLLTPYQLVTANMATSRMIMCQSHQLFPNLRIEWRLVDSVDSLDSFEQTFSFSVLTQDNTTGYYYQTLLTNLQPNSTYEYRLTNDKQISPWFRLTTPLDRSNFTALLFSDSQCANSYKTWQSNLQAAKKRHPTAEWFADIGDLTDNGESSWHWQEFINTLTTASELPFVPIMGNHECYGLDWKFCQPTRYLKSFVLPQNALASDSGYYYFFDYGPVRFFCLNSQLLELASSKPDLLQQQIAWLHQNKTTHLKWQVVLMHKDILAYDEYQAGSQTTGGFSDVGRAFMPFFDEIGIDLVVTGHMHTYRNRGHIKNFQPSTTGPLYIMSGPIGNEQYTVPSDPLDKIMSSQPTAENYLLLQASEQTLTLINYQYNGSCNDAVTLTKE